MKFTDDRPIYLQIADDIRNRILVGELNPGDQLMSTTQYATTYRINPATANKAFNILVEEHVVEKKRGIGMFVAPEAATLLKEKGRAAYSTDVLLPALEHGLHLGLTADDILTLAAAQLTAGTSHHTTREES
ncbi:GntR family transcriptional regulator [Arcanobacterium haemolyticum]|nr:GntR family transcriptional regulator [Arcanobacterium haemolyticum]